MNTLAQEIEAFATKSAHLRFSQWNSDSYWELNHEDPTGMNLTKIARNLSEKYDSGFTTIRVELQILETQIFKALGGM